MALVGLFPKRTTDYDDQRITAIIEDMKEHGFKGHVIVFENAVDAGLGMVASSLCGLKGEYARAVLPRGQGAVIATQTAEDGKLLEEKLRELQAMLPNIFPHLIL